MESADQLEPSASLKNIYVKVSLLQMPPFKGMEELTAAVRRVIEHQRRYDISIARWVLLCEEAVVSFAFRQNDAACEKAMQPLLEVSRDVGVSFTCEERERNNIFRTMVVLDKGRIVAVYRKRKATRVGAHAEGHEAVWFPCGDDDDDGCDIGCLICYDAEHEHLREETLSRRRPFAIFNPTYIPSTPTTSAPPQWRTAIESMRLVFSRMCRLRSFSLVRCDSVAPSAVGSSQLISPYCAVNGCWNAPCITNVFVDKAQSDNDQKSAPSDTFPDVHSLWPNHFGRFTRPPHRPRTMLEQNIASQYDTRYIPPHMTNINAVFGCASFVSSTFLCALSSSHAAFIRSRDGHATSLFQLPGVAPNWKDICSLSPSQMLVVDPSKGSFCTFDSSSSSSSVFSVDSLTFPSSKWCRLHSTTSHHHQIVFSCSSSISSMDLRLPTPQVNTLSPSSSSSSLFTSVSTSDTFSCFASTLDDWFLSYDFRRPDAPVTKVHSSSGPISCVSKMAFACGPHFFRVDDDGTNEASLVCTLDSNILCLDDQSATFAGCADGTIRWPLGKRQEHHVMAFHSRPVHRCNLSLDGSQLLSISSGGANAIALTSFHQNSEKCDITKEIDDKYF